MTTPSSRLVSLLPKIRMTLTVSERISGELYGSIFREASIFLSVGIILPSVYAYQDNFSIVLDDPERQSSPPIAKAANSLAQLE